MYQRVDHIQFTWEKKSFNKTELAVAGFYAHYIPFLYDDKRQGNKHTIPSVS